MTCLTLFLCPKHASDRKPASQKPRWMRVSLMFLSCLRGRVVAAAQSGTVKPKYVVVSVIYAPPGQGSTVNYGSSTWSASPRSLIIHLRRAQPLAHRSRWADSGTRPDERQFGIVHADPGDQHFDCNQ